MLNKELDELKHQNIINYVKSQRLNWFGRKYPKLVL
jgi:hypothetical protein